MLKYMMEDIQRAKAEDPAAPSTATVLLCYSGLHALWNHRLEHWLWTRGQRGLARWLSTVSRHFTGVEIHPGAQIGRRVFIDHGMGIVIGETTIIGDDCTLYQGCTLGGTGKETGKRHPTLANNVIVGVGAAVLGNINIGDNSKIGGGAVVVSDVPNDCTVVGIPGHVVRRKGKKVSAADEARGRRVEDLPDPIIGLIEQLKRRIDLLDRRIEMLKCTPGGNLAQMALRDDVAVSVPNKSLAAQMLSEENLIREAEGKLALDRERRRAEEGGAAGAEGKGGKGAESAGHDADGLESVSRAVASFLGDRVASAPEQASREQIASIVSDALKELSEKVAEQSARAK